MAKEAQAQVISTPQAESQPPQQQASPAGSHYIWPSEYRPPDPAKIVNAQPGFRYRLLSKNRIAREGGNTRDWEIVQGNDQEHSVDPEARRLMGTGAPHGTTAPDTTRHVGDLIVARMPEYYAQSKEKYLAEQSSAQVRRVLAKDDKEGNAEMEEVLRKAGVEPNLVKRFLNFGGGAMVMNPEER